MAEFGLATVRHVCELCGEGGLSEAELRTHVLLVHVEGLTLPSNHIQVGTVLHTVVSSPVIFSSFGSGSPQSNLA